MKTIEVIYSGYDGVHSAKRTSPLENKAKVTMKYLLGSRDLPSPII